MSTVLNVVKNILLKQTNNCLKRNVELLFKSVLLAVIMSN